MSGTLFCTLDFKGQCVVAPHILLRHFQAGLCYSSCFLKCYNKYFPIKTIYHLFKIFRHACRPATQTFQTLKNGRKLCTQCSPSEGETNLFYTVGESDINLDMLVILSRYLGLLEWMDKNRRIKQKRLEM